MCPLFSFEVYIYRKLLLKRKEASAIEMWFHDIVNITHGEYWRVTCVRCGGRGKMYIRATTWLLSWTQAGGAHKKRLCVLRRQNGTHFSVCV